MNGIDPSGRDSLWAGGPDLGPIVPSIQIPDIPNPVDWAFNQVGQLGQDAERYWADRSNHDTGIAKFGDTVAGTLAAMADCNNLPITVTVLSLGTAVSGVAVDSEALGRIVIRRYPNAAGGGITYRAPCTSSEAACYTMIEPDICIMRVQGQSLINRIVGLRKVLQHTMCHAQISQCLSTLQRST